jgi:hydroxymethylpyrimidine/phosphomethylpyrimidine kinase
MRRALTIAGSDSSAGAGIQADLKTFAAFGVYGLSAVTAVTAQNTEGVRAVHAVPAEIVAAQIDAVLEDIGVDAVKTGMLANAGIIEVVGERLRAHGVGRLVVDPVLAATSGRDLLDPGALDVLRRVLLPLAVVVTPNYAEAEALTGRVVRTPADAREAARALVALGSPNAVVKGGHARGPAIDILFDGCHFQEFSAPRLETRHTHGTGCTFAAAVTAELASDAGVPEAVARAKAYVTGALHHAPGLGRGHGPLGHFHPEQLRR